MYFSVRSVSYHVNLLETADPQASYIVLLHGFMGDGRCFDLLVSQLRDTFHIVTVDLPGHGQTRGATTAARYKTEEQLLDLKLLFEDMSLPPFFLYGYSMGGRLALRFALQHPAMLKGMILESAHAGIKSPSTRKQRSKKDHRWARWIKRDFSSFLSWWQQLDIFQTHSPAGNQQSWYTKIQHSQDPEQLAMSLQKFGQGAVPPVHRHLSQLYLPTLLATGEYDAKYRERMKRMQADLPHAQLKIISDAAHRVHLDAPQQWYPVIKNFILNH